MLWSCTTTGPSERALEGVAALGPESDLAPEPETEPEPAARPEPEPGPESEPEREPEGEREPEPEPEPERESEPEHVSLTLVSVEFVEGKMHLDILDAPHNTHAWERGGVLMQSWRLPDDTTLRVVVRVGEGESLDQVEDFRPRMKFGAQDPLTVCGQAARRIEGRSPAEEIECIKFADGRPNAPGSIPALTTVMVAFRHGELGGTAEWTIPSAHREAYRSLEERFFASLQCDGSWS